jgi:hypothetical protein
MPGQQSLPRHNGSLLPQARTRGFSSDGQSAPLIIVESQPPFAQLLPEHTVLLAQIIDELVLALIHPAGQGDQHEMERIEDSLHVVPSLSPACSCADQLSSIQVDALSGHYGVGQTGRHHAHRSFSGLIHFPKPMPRNAGSFWRWAPFWHSTPLLRSCLSCCAGLIRRFPPCRLNAG